MTRLPLLALVALLCIAPPSFAQQYPIKPVRLTHSFPPGGSTDLLAHTVSQKVQESLGQSIASNCSWTTKPPGIP